MKGQASFGIGLMLAAIFILQPVAICAAMLQPGSSHACCRHSTPVQSSSDRQCCRSSAVPNSPVTLSGVQTEGWIDLPTIGQFTADCSVLEAVSTLNLQ